jgi:Protein of unknown function (DUF4435)
MNQQTITYQDKIDELQFDIKHPQSEDFVFIFVEGESDIRLFRKIFDSNRCKVESIPGGNSKVEDCVKLLLHISNLIIGIRDADFLHLSEAPYAKENMFLTDYHDIEMDLILNDTIFSSIMSEFTDFPTERHDSIRTDIFKILEDLSLLKLVNFESNFEIPFEGVGFQDNNILSISENFFDTNTYLERLFAKNNNNRHLKTELLEKILEKKDLGHSFWQITNGHDFMKVLATFLREQAKAKGISDDMLSSIFRTNYRKEYFEQTRLYQSTKDWADSKHITIYENN